MSGKFGEKPFNLIRPCINNDMIAMNVLDI
jgi:hypothetical protein